MRSPRPPVLMSTTPMFEGVYGPVVPKHDFETDPWHFAYIFGVWNRDERAAASAALRGRPPEDWERILLDLGHPPPPEVEVPDVGAPLRLSGFAGLPGMTPHKRVITAIAREPWWGPRLGHLEEWVSQSIGDPYRDHGTRAAMMAALSLRWTIVLEHIEPEPIVSIQHAAARLLTTHEPWKRAALEWVEPFRKTWWPLFLRDRPVIARMVRFAMQQPEGRSDE